MSVDVREATTVASKTPVKEVSRAPGTVYVFTSEDLYKQGILTVADLLKRIPGIQMQPTTQEGMQVWFRGVQNQYNSNVLLLIDSVPMRDYFFGHFHVDEMLPVENIEKIEVLVGPGSVIHGANAFAGVINITTKRKGNEVRVRGGDFDTIGGTGLLSGDRLSVFVKALKSENGFVPRLGGKGLPRRFPLPADRELYLIDVKYALSPNLTLKYYYTHYQYYAPYTSNKNRDFLTRDPWGASFNYAQGDLETLKINAVGYFNQYDFNQDSFSVSKKGPVTPHDRGEKIWNTQYMGFDVYVSKKIKKHTILVGTSLISYKGTKDIGEKEYDITVSPEVLTKDGDLLFNRTRTQNDYSFYAQDQWIATENLDVTAGIRFTRPQFYDQQWNYRLGAVYSLDEETYFKALVGTSFRVPTFREARFIKDDGSIRFDPNLKPEHMTTYELSVGRKKANGNSWLLTGFYNVYKDFITNVAPPSFFPPGLTPDDDAFINVDERIIKGVELSADWWFVDNLIRFRPGFAYIDGKDNTLNSGLHGLSDWVGYTETSFKLTDYLTVGLVTSFVSTPFVNRDIYQQNIKVPKDPTLLGGYITLGTYANYKILDHLDFQFVGRNITNRLYYSPHTGSKYDYQWPGAEFSFQLRSRF